ncbi:TRAP-type C4-dicarboxylate transport system permease small subunit [Halanaerobium saccharolyticum]|jgi:TRAP-type C4-dicarboxylate transport system permease small subunit|uniref:TRAP-type C4-dicarboxylate transport system permease small subunit n=1 Tax=Halanaerobium saccharolyticum TaxID=43595 RepID=A0A4R7Z272_9FIRM|nr:TRAP transporter small permease subunit [Halanaerobium saccharolyticum]RAK07463.1 TRAP-type C4-dicarboxylate transport system permease small subunit [Halanaerobium saccharolyticum]TDW03040.1 TRAP-type C4-dicarboxylate transport system permease small subunit [Halanaerobium saccharolyticum]TDX59336.1 TRAP-type C4-dicarboxylate transport system permease small subunit [Halanaerobium saccharolyticum]
MKNNLLKIYSFIINFMEETIPSIAILLIILVLIVQVFMRTVFRISYTSLYELSLWGYVWLLYFGASYARRKDKHVRLDIIYEKFPTKVQKGLNIFFNLFVTVVFVILLPDIWEYLMFVSRIKTHTLRWSWTYVFSPFFIFMVLVIIHNLEYIYKDLKYILDN